MMSLMRCFNVPVYPSSVVLLNLKAFYYLITPMHQL
uniref:Uncharacterized protein n=1 Tax=Arundo donax TaxID=35708 RepID=A0A0A8Z0W9_ARUDO